MLIQSIDLYRVAMPLKSPFTTAFGDTRVVECVLVKMSDGEVDGWGEAAPWASPLYSAEWAAGAYLLIRDSLAPMLLGKSIESGDRLQECLAPIKGNPFAKSALDLAWWDLHARRERKPLWKVLGGSSDTVDVGADFGVMNSIKVLIEAVEEAVASGFKRVKLKIRSGWDLGMVTAVRKAFPKTVLHVDANGGYRMRDVELFRALDDCHLAMIEQPLAHDDLLDHAKLQKEIKTPICLDESITSLDKAVQAAEIGACRWINIKPGRVGGITPARHILRATRKAGIPCWIGGMLESAVGASHCLALATLRNIDYPSDVFPSRRFYERDLADSDIELSGPSQVKAFGGDGIGCAPEESRLEALTIEACRVGRESVRAL